MKISIIIIVKNDRGIANTLRSIFAISGSLQPSEVIVVDSSSPEQLTDIKQQFSKVKLIYYKNSSHKLSTIPEQRNVGIRSSSGDIVVFIDANCIPGELWLERLCRPILDEHEKIVSGTVRSIDPKALNNLSDENRLYGEYLPECATINLAISRDVFDRVGYFDEDFLYGSDVDFTWRAVDSGYRIKLVPEAYVSHDWGNFQDELKRSIKYGSARVRLYLKHRHRLGNLLGFDIRTLVYPIYLLGLPIALFWPWYILLLLIPMYRSRSTKKPIKFTFLSLVYGYGVIRGFFTSSR